MIRTVREVVEEGVSGSHFDHYLDKCTFRGIRRKSCSPRQAVVTPKRGTVSNHGTVGGKAVN